MISEKNIFNKQTNNIMAIINSKNTLKTYKQSVLNSVVRPLLFAVGSISIALGVLGIFLPLLPTTPFLLLSAACYVRSSDKFYRWLISHPVLSKYILAYLNGEGIPRKAKCYTLLTMWLTMGVSAFIVPLWQVQILLLCIALMVSTYIWRLPEPDL